ncbi:MAG TPA: hypothetical protein ACFYEA_09610 [Candidatus Tripitaka californicus]|uniref:hypothetical protein n=1 Tax=Candidatus Tripitaka californicus TaxID=3367616 RepID=UPI004024C32F|nr:Ig-like domain-containing protein [Planctomycetota bacterium]
MEPSQLLLGIGERDWVRVTVVDAAGRPLAGVTLSVQSDRADILSVSKEGLSVTDNYGHISFSALGRQTGGCNINIFDGLNTVRINTVVKELRRYVLTFYYGNSEIQLVNPTEVTNFIKIKFYPDEGQAYPPMYLTLLEKQRKKVVLSEQYGEPLPYGWVEVMSTQELLGGLWTNKGYLPLYESK